MRILGGIVEIAALPMLDIGQQVALRHPIAPEFVGDDHSRFILEALQQTLEKPFGGFRIPSVLHKDIEDHAALINGTPQIMLNALDPDEHLIEVPLVPRSRPTASQTVRKAPAKFPTPASHRLMGNNDGPLSQQQFHIAQAEAEHVVQPNSVADNLRGKAMAVVWIGWLLHAAILARTCHARHPPVTVTMPLGCLADDSPTFLITGPRDLKSVPVAPYAAAASSWERPPGLAAPPNIATECAAGY
jgi:hypothetical protein